MVLSLITVFARCCHKKITLIVCFLIFHNFIMHLWQFLILFLRNAVLGEHDCCERCFLTLFDFPQGTVRHGKTDFPSMPVQLPTDYSTVTSIITPEKKAHVMHNVSNLFIVIFKAYFVQKCNLILFRLYWTVE